MLHSHLPYVRENGTWPHGEEWLYEALAETQPAWVEQRAGAAYPHAHTVGQGFERVGFSAAVAFNALNRQPDPDARAIGQRSSNA